MRLRGFGVVTPSVSGPVELGAKYIPMTFQNVPRYSTRQPGTMRSYSVESISSGGTPTIGIRHIRDGMETSLIDQYVKLALDQSASLIGNWVADKWVQERSTSDVTLSN